MKKKAALGHTKVLLVSCVLSAGLAVYLTQQKDSASSSARDVSNEEEGGPSSSDIVGRRLLTRPTGSGPSDDRPLSFGPAMEMALSDDELRAMKVPSDEEALALRKKTVERRLDIQQGGIDALIEPSLDCAGDQEAIETARAGHGVYACAEVAEDGLITIVGEAVHRKRNGNFEVGKYDGGRRVGIWEQYYPTGILAARGEFVDDQRHGTWDEFDENGLHQVSRNYELGRKQGLTVSYGGVTPKVELWSSLGQLNLETKQPIVQEEIVEL